MNTLSNCQGCVPRMDCGVVRIFRKHGFAWGGNFRAPRRDALRVGRRPRDQIAYPSTYCPNVVNALTQSQGEAAERGREVLVDGADAAHQHVHDH
jgi:hypothetical protein